MIRSLLVLLLLLSLTPATAQAAIAKLAASVEEETFSAASAQNQTISVTVPSGSDRILVVRIQYVSNDSAQMVTSVTFGGVALSLAGRHTYTVSVARALDIWYLVAPAVSTANVVIDLGGTTTFSYCYSVSDSWSGVDQTTPIGLFSEVEELSGGTAHSLTANSNTNDFVLDILGCFTAGAQTFTVGGGQSIDFIEENANLVSSATSREVATGASTVMSWTLGTAANTYQAAINLRPTGSSTPNTSTRLLRGCCE